MLARSRARGSSSGAGPPAATGMLARAGAPAPPRAKRQRGPAATAAEASRRDERAQGRKRRLAEAEQSWSRGRTFLESRSVAVGQEKLYETLMASFLAWAAAHKLPLTTVAEKDEAAVIRGDAMYFEGATAGDFSKLRAAAAFHWQLGRAGVDLKRAARAQVGFNKLAPAMTRLPMPLVLMHMIINAMVFLGSPWEMCMCVALMYALYLRPVDVISMRLEDLVAPLTGAGTGHSLWSVVLHPAEGVQPSKAGLYDEALVLDNHEYDDLVPGLLWLRAGPGHACSPSSTRSWRSTSARR